MKYKLVLQFKGKAFSDFDALIALEDRLITGLGGDADVDGHDFGSGEGNIFIGTDDPRATFKKTTELLDVSEMGELRAAYREVEKEGYVILWPPDLQGFSVI